MNSSADIEVMQVPPFITIPDVRKYFGIQRRKAWNLIKAKRIKASKSGRSWLVESKSVIRHLRYLTNGNPNA